MSQRRALKNIAICIGVLVLLAVVAQNCGKPMGLRSNNSGTSGSSGGGTNDPGAGPPSPEVTPVPDLSGFTNFNPSQTLGSKIGFWEYNLPVARFIDKLYPTKVVVSSNGNIYVVSACGVFVSKDGGASFTEFNLPGVNERPLPYSFFVDGNNIYVGTMVGIFASRDNGNTFTQILDVTKARNTLTAHPYACTAVSPGLNLIIFSIYASGNDIFAGTNLGLLVSHDGGVTFTVPAMTSGGFYLPPVTPIAAIVAGNGKIYVAAGNGNGAANRFNTAPIGSTNCAINPQLPNYGLLVSTDNGATFSAVSDFSFSTYSLAVNGSDIYAVASGHLNSDGSLGSGFVHSADGGVTFSNVTLQTADFLEEFVPVVRVGTTVFTANNSPRNYSVLAKSTDDGATFSNVVVDPQILTGYSLITSLATQANNIYVMTDRGLYISHDAGATFATHKTFSSNFCTYPWWSNLSSGGAPTAASSGTNLYFSLSPSLYGVSRDGAKSFSTFSATGNVLELYASGNEVFIDHGSGQNMQVSTDAGSTFGAAVTSAAVTGTATKLSVTSPIAGFYVSSDGTDQLTQVSTLAPNAAVSSAISQGTRLVAGGSGMGIGVFDSGKVIYSNMNVRQNSGPEFIRIRYVNGAFFALGDQLWASFDNGASFAVAPGSPHFPQDLYAIGDNIYVIEGGYLYISKDGGHTFTPWTGTLN